MKTSLIAFLICLIMTGCKAQPIYDVPEKSPEEVEMPQQQEEEKHRYNYQIRCAVDDTLFHTDSYKQLSSNSIEFEEETYGHMVISGTYYIVGEENEN